MNPRPRVFVANLDAELELIDPGYVRQRRMRASIRERVSALASSMSAAIGGPPPLLVVDRDDLARVRAEELAGDGDCWCPTPSALALLGELGVAAPLAPPLDVLRRVNHRAFAAGLGIALEGAVFATDLAACERAFAAAPERRVVLKRPLGFAGRMRKVVVPSRLDAAARTWIRASMDDYGQGLQIEPFVDVAMDFSLHGRVLSDATARCGKPVRLVNDAEGAFGSARLATEGELTAREREALYDALQRVAGALVDARYVGPFGIDAFRWREGRAAVPRAV